MNKEAKQNQVDIYTDGSCLLRNGLNGGWAYIIFDGGSCRQGSGSKIATSPFEMELTAIVKAIKKLGSERRTVNVYTDSMAVVDAVKLKSIIPLLTGDKKSTIDMALWNELFRLCNHHIISFRWVKAHSDNQWNNIVDLLAKSAAKKSLNNDEPNRKGSRKDKFTTKRMRRDFKKKSEKYHDSDFAEQLKEVAF